VELTQQQQQPQIVRRRVGRQQPQLIKQRLDMGDVVEQ
jgi:hypothetical protein